MSFLKETENDILTLELGDQQQIEWFVYAAFAVHPDMKGHTGAVSTLGKGAFSALSTKQKTNSRSSTEAELIGLDNVISKILWQKRFIEKQGFTLDGNIIFRNNTSSMKLEQNGHASTSEHTRHFDIRYFYITDLIQTKECEIKYCPTKEMVADYHTKPLMGAQFAKFHDKIMNFQPTIP